MNSVISKGLRFLLQWTRGLVANFWARINSPEPANVGWFEQLWLPLVIVLLIAGTAIDILVYRKRWRPDWIRKSLHQYRAAQTSIPVQAANTPAPRTVRPTQGNASVQADTPDDDDFRFDDVPEAWPDATDTVRVRPLGEVDSLSDKTKAYKRQ